jgi:uncharacterized protein
MTHPASDPNTSDAFHPPWYLRSGHLQTLITGFYRPIAPLPNPIVHAVPIGEFGHMLVHENRPDSIADVAAAPAVLLLHGLGSSHAGTYMTNIASRLLSRGFRVFRADLPGAGPSCETTPLPPHGACHPLVLDCLRHLSHTLTIPQWHLVGISLGGSILLRLLVELATNSAPPSALADAAPWSVASAIAVAPPIDLAASCIHVEKGVNLLYAKYFVRALKRQTLQRAALWDSWKARLPHADFSTIRKFDETVTVHLAGFRDANAYYEAGSSHHHLQAIRVPTTILVDEQDPIVPVSLFDRAELSPTTRLVRTRFGGHVGYLARLPASSANPAGWTRWADEWIVRELASKLDSTTL